jgi:hypothetical protein
MNRSILTNCELSRMTRAPLSHSTRLQRTGLNGAPAVARGRRGKYSAGGYLRPFFAYTLGMSRYDRPSHQGYMYFFKL